jgi:hypothetical protein
VIALPRPSEEERFWSKVAKVGEGCWLWNGAIVSSGYGCFWSAGRAVGAHRWSYQRIVGPIPSGLHLDHLCRVRNCVNPAHLEPVTQAENTLRGVGLAAANASKTHCPAGHEYTPENTYREGRRRRCKTCHLDRCRRRRAA